MFKDLNERDGIHLLNKNDFHFAFRLRDYRGNDVLGDPRILFEINKVSAVWTQDLNSESP